MTTVTFSREPVLYHQDIKLLSKLFPFFDRMKLNPYGDYYVQKTMKIPVFGEVILSLYVAEDHVQILNEKSNACIWDGYWREFNLAPISESIPDEKELVPIVLRLIRDKITKNINTLEGVEETNADED